MTVNEPGYSGAFNVSNNTAPSVASASLSNAILTITALASGSTTISVSDSVGNTSTCLVNVN